MKIRLRVMDYTLEDEGYCVGVFTDPDRLKCVVADYIIQAEGHCTELMCEEWDWKYSTWLSFSPLSDAMNHYIGVFLKRYKKLIRGERT